MFADENGDCFGSYQDQMRELEDRIRTLEMAITRHHQKTKGHNMCWENDVELWKAVGIKADHPDPPDWCEFMTKCAEYRKSREK